MTVGKFIVRVLAGIGLLFLITGSLGAYSVWHWMRTPAKAPKAPEAMTLEIDLSIPIVEQRRGMSLSLGTLLESEEETALLDLITALDRASDDPRVKGIVARLGSVQPSLVHTQEIRDALLRFRDKGKFTYIFATNYGNFGQSNRAYYLASVFENIWVQPVGTVSLTGLGVETPFAKSLLDKLGVQADFLRREEYKSVMENVTNDKFSPAVRDNMQSLMNNVNDQLVAGIAEGRKVAPDKVRDWMARGPFTGQEAMKEGLITRIGYANEMLETAKILATGFEPGTKLLRSPTLVSPERYLSFERQAPAPKATVALINGSGLIADVPDAPSRLTRDNVMDADAIVRAFAQASKDPSVKAILFRVDSPGGSPEVSETIRHALVRAKKTHKPVFVSMGDVAGSGGYWIAGDADYILAAPGTITGSIGVVAGKFVIGGLADKIGVTWDKLATNDNTNMWSMTEPFSERGRERMNALLDDTYATFIGNVAKARKIPMEKMSDIAKGRVWTGAQAKEVGLVDEVGGMKASVQAIKKKLALKPTDEVRLKPFPPPETPATLAIKLLRNLKIEAASLAFGLRVLSQTEQTLSPVLEDIETTGAISAKIPWSFREAF